VLPDLEDGVWKVSKDSMNFAILSNDHIANEAFDNEYCGKMTKQKVDDGKKSST